MRMNNKSSSAIFIFIVFVFIYGAKAQNKNTDTLKVKKDMVRHPPDILWDDSYIEHTDYDEAPVPPGGMEGYRNYLVNNIHYPDSAINAGASGTVYISIVVNQDGSLTNVLIQRDNVHYGCGQEAIRVIKKMPPWKPGKIKGRAVKVKYIVPVMFRLHG